MAKYIFSDKFNGLVSNWLKTYPSNYKKYITILQQLKNGLLAKSNPSSEI